MFFEGGNLPSPDYTPPPMPPEDWAWGFIGSIGSFAVVMAVGFRFADAFRRPDGRLPRYATPVLAAFVAVSLIVAVGTIYRITVEARSFRLLLEHFGPWRRLAFGGVVAGALFWLRTRWLWVYAAIEILIGGIMLFVASDISGPPMNRLAQTLTYMAAIYVLIRGLTNLDNGLPLSARTAIAKAWRSFLRGDQPS